MEEGFWSDARPYYILYQDKTFLKNIYAQLFADFPDIGVVAYIGANTHRTTKDYSVDGERCGSNNKKKSCKEDEIEKERNIRQENRNKAGISVINSDEYSEIREYANIHEIKEMNNMLFYKRILKEIALKCASGDCKSLCYMKEKIQLYDSFKEEEDIFVKMGNSCIWLKQSNLDTTAMNLANVMGKVNMIGYILEEETVDTPRVIKAIAMYT